MRLSSISRPSERTPSSSNDSANAVILALLAPGIRILAMAIAFSKSASFGMSAASNIFGLRPLASRRVPWYVAVAVM